MLVRVDVGVFVFGRIVRIVRIPRRLYLYLWLYHDCDRRSKGRRKERRRM